MTARVLAAALAGLGLLVGCSFVRPTVPEVVGPLPQQYLAATASDSATTPVERWWELFRDERLSALIDELLQQNLAIEQAFARLEQSRALARSARSARFPALGVNAESGRSMQPTSGDDFTGDSSRLAAAAAFELDLWGKLAARAGATERLAAASLEDVRTLYLGLTAQLADLYYLAVEQRAQLALTDQTISSFTDTVARVESRYRMGLVPALDVYQARQNLASAEAARHAFEANLAVADHAIAVLISRYPEQTSAGDLALLPEMPRAFPVGLPSQLVARRPDLRAALYRIEAADQNVAAAVAERFPSINLLGNYGGTRQEFATGLIEGNFWNLLGTLSAPVFDAGRRQAEVERSRAVVREAVAAYQLAALNAFREVEDALATSYANEQRIGRLLATIRATDAALRLALQRYMYGLSDYLPVLTAQRNHFEAQSRLLSVRRQLISARVGLARALGGHWMDEEISQRLTADDGGPLQ